MIIGTCALALVSGCLGGEANGPMTGDASTPVPDGAVVDGGTGDGSVVDGQTADATQADAGPTADGSVLPSGFSARVNIVGAGGSMRCIYDGSEGVNAVKTWTAQPQPHILLKCASPAGAGLTQYIVTLTINPLGSGNVLANSDITVQKVGGGSVILSTAQQKVVNVTTYAPAVPHLIGTFSASWTTGIGGVATGLVGSFDVR